MRLCLMRRFPPLALHKRILNSPCLHILLIHTKHKTIRWNLELTPRLHSLEEDLIHWVGNAKNAWLTVGQLPMNAGWWDAPLALLYFSHKYKIPTTGVTQENPELLPPPNSLDSHQTQNNKMISWTDPKSSFTWRRTHQLGR